MPRLLDLIIVFLKFSQKNHHNSVMATVVVSAHRLRSSSHEA
jgi:hypothetical protein